MALLSPVTPISVSSLGAAGSWAALGLPWPLGLCWWPWTERGLQEHVPERGRAVRGRAGTRGLRGQSSCRRGCGRGSVPSSTDRAWMVLLAPGLRVQSLCGPFTLELDSMIFVVPSNSGYSVIRVTLAVPGLPDSVTGAELAVLTLPLFLHPPLPWLGLLNAFCCPACHQGLRPSQWCGGHQQVALLPHCLLPPPGAPRPSPQSFI